MVLESQLIFKAIEFIIAGIIFSIAGFSKNKETRKKALWFLIIYLIIIALI